MANIRELKINEDSTVEASSIVFVFIGFLVEKYFNKKY